VEQRRVGDESLLTTTAPTTSAVPTGAPGQSSSATEPIDTVPSGSSGLSLTVASRTGVPRAGVPVRVTGPVERVLVTDATGQARLQGPAGRYEARIEPGCTDTVQVQTGASARIAVPDGEVVSGRLTVEARRRRFPGAPVTWAARQPDARTERSGRLWRIGVPYVVRYTLVDRCEGAPAPGAVVEELAFPSPFPLEVQVQDAPADATGRAALLVTCRDAGDEVELLVADPGQPDDRVDLFSRALLDDTAPSCVA
jgi:hypothetical protein